MRNLISQLKSFWKGSQFIQSVAVLAGGTALGQGVVVLSLPLITRLYTPEALGKLGIFTAFVSVVSVASSFLYEAAIVSAKNEQEAANLSILSIIIAIFTTPVALIIYFLLIKFNWLGFSILPVSSLLLTSLGILLTAIFKVLRYWLIRRSNFTLISQITIFQNIAKALSQVTFGFFKLDWLGLLIGELIGRGLGLGQMLRQSWQELIYLVTPFKFKNLTDVATQHLHFPLYALPSSLIDILAMSLSVPLVTQFYGSQSAGYFFLAQRVISLPLALIGSSVADSFHSQVSAYNISEPLKVKKFFLKTAKTLALIGLFPTLILIIFGTQLFTLIFGQTWSSAGLLASIMSFWAWAGLVVSPISRIVFVLGGQKSKLLYDIFALLVLILSLYGGFKLNLSLTTSITLLSGFNVLAYGLYFLILLQIVNKST